MSVQNFDISAIANFPADTLFNEGSDPQQTLPDLGVCLLLSGLKKMFRRTIFGGHLLDPVVIWLGKKSSAEFSQISGIYRRRLAESQPPEDFRPTYFVPGN